MTPSQMPKCTCTICEARKIADIRAGLNAQYQRKLDYARFFDVPIESISFEPTANAVNLPIETEWRPNPLVTMVLAAVCCTTFLAVIWFFAKAIAQQAGII